MSELPKGWEAPGLVEICDFNPKHDPDTDREQLVSFVPMPAVSDETGTIETPRDRPLSKIWKGYTHFQNGDVIFAKITPCMENGKSAVAGNLTNGLACGSTEFHVLRPRGGVLPDYIWKFVRQVEFRRDAEAHMAGAVGQRRVPKPYLEKHPIPLPPLAEQRRIVRKLDTLSARTTTACTHLSAIAKLVERYKLAVLGQLFGKSGTDPKPTEHLWAIPEHWSWKKVKEIGEVGLGRQRSPQNHSGPFMRPYLRSANITWLGVDTSDVKEMNFDAADFERFELKHGDVLLNEGSGSAKEVGKPAIWRGEITNCCYQNTVLRVQPRDCSSEYLYWYFLLTALSEGFVGDTKGVNIQHIGKNGLANFPIPVPPRSEQDEIVLNIQTAFTKIDLLIAEAEKALKLTERLDQRILAKAFAGGLDLQDPNDEPASVLLDRIRAERASAPKPQRGRKKKADA